MEKPISQTQLLSPYTAIQLAWAMTGQFSKAAESKYAYLTAEKTLKDIEEKASGIEKDYIKQSIAVISAGMRTLDTVYKGRELNFEENEKIRSVALDNIKESLEFGKKAQDFLKSLPAMTVTTGSGVVISAEVLNLPSSAVWGVGVVLAGLSYWINLYFVRRANKKKESVYIRQDYERNIYYEQYINRVITTLTTIFNDIERIHKRFFGKPYNGESSGNVSQVVEETITGAKPTLCRYVFDHMKQELITVKNWPRCEAGGRAAEECELWGKYTLKH